MPLVVRYLLETCTTVPEAVAALRRIPVQAAYNVTVIDRDGDHATVWLVPDRPAEVTRRRATTNHQARVDWPQHARWTRSEERLDVLEAVLADPERLISSMTRSPLRSTNVSEGFATLYTAVYRPAEGSVEYRWPDSAWRHSFERFDEGTHEVTIGADRPLAGCRVNRRELLEEVAAGRLAPREAARLLDPPPPEGAARAARVRSAYGAVEVLGDPAVPELVVADGSRRIQREGDLLVIGDAAPGPAAWQAGRRLALRANPELALDLEIIGASLSVWGMTGPIRAVVQAGSGSLEGVRGALDLRVVSGTARVLGAPETGDWALRAENAGLEVVLLAGADAAVSVASRHSEVNADRPETLGRGTHAVAVDADYSAVTIRSR